MKQYKERIIEIFENYLVDPENERPGIRWAFEPIKKETDQQENDLSLTLNNTEKGLSLLENKPAYSEPKATTIAPVKVAKSIIKFGLNFFSVNVIASAKTNLPSASVFKTSIVFPL